MKKKYKVFMKEEYLYVVEAESEEEARDIASNRSYEASSIEFIRDFPDSAEIEEVEKSAV